MNGLISASVMCADLLHLEENAQALEKAGVDFYHIDIMDGHFVPNLTFGPDLTNCLRSCAHLPFDIHFMTEKPEEMIGYFDIKPGDIISVHTESTVHLQKVLQMIRAKGALPIAAVNPATPFSALEEVLSDLYGVQIMAVNPGFAGQKAVPQVFEKIRRFKSILNERGFGHLKIEVDGNVSIENAIKMSSAGADIFVAGTSSIFKKNVDIGESVKMLRNAIDQAKK